jgi:hypothetical protein
VAGAKQTKNRGVTTWTNGEGKGGNIISMIAGVTAYGGGEGVTSFRRHENNMTYCKNNNGIGLETICVISPKYFILPCRVFVPFHTAKFTGEKIFYVKKFLSGLENKK